jgi:hypothetical protein
MFKNKKELSNVPTDTGKIKFILAESSEKEAPVNIIKGVEGIPDWYKKLDNRTSGKDGFAGFTIKRCIPVLDVLVTGYYVVTAKDYEFVFDEARGSHSIKGSFNPQYQPISTHPIEQLGGMPFSDEYCVFAYKWTNPYVIKTPAGYSTLVTHPTNAPYLPFYTLSGVVDTDAYFRPINFPFLMKKSFSGILPAGTPIAQIIPFKRDDWESETINKPSPEFLISEKILAEEYEKDRFAAGGKEVGGVYKRLYRKKKKYL